MRLDHRVRRQAARGLPEVHRAARRVEPDADLARRGDLGREQVARASREDVVVIHRRAAPGQRQPAEIRGGGGVDEVVA